VPRARSHGRDRPLRVAKAACTAAAVCTGAALLLPTNAAGQTAVLPGRVEIQAGVSWLGSATAGARSATLTAASGGDLALFETASELGGSVLGGIGLGVRLSRALQAEAALSYGTPSLRSRISADREEVPPVTLTERLKQFTVEGTLIVHLVGVQWGRATPFVSAGAGYLRHLHEGDALAEHGSVYHAGAGVTIPVMTAVSGRLKALAVRAEARARVQRGGAAFERRTALVPVVSSSVVLRF
jgi:hypothetical protein